MSSAPIHVRIVVEDDCTPVINRFLEELTRIGSDLSFRIRNRMRRKPQTPRQGAQLRKHYPRRRHGR